MSARRVDVIANRRARHLVRETGLLATLRDAAREAGARIHETAAPDDLGSLCARLAHDGTDRVILAGGDGSYMAGTSALVEAFGGSPPPLAFLPGGTVSTVARNWGLSGDPERYARRLVSAVANGSARSTRRPTLRVRDDEGRTMVGFIFGAGLVASFFDAYYASPLQGYAGAAAIVARVFAGTFTGGRLAKAVLEPVPMKLIVDDAPCDPTAFSLVAASVVRDLGLHMRLLYRAAEETARFHVVASPLPPRALAPQVGRVLAGRSLRGEGNVDALATSLRLSFGQGASRGHYVLDGELFAAGSVEVTAGPVVDHLSV